MTDNSMHFKSSMLAIAGIVIIIFAAKSFFVGSGATKKVDNSTLAERIQPIGQVYLEGDIDVAAVAAAPKAQEKQARSGEDVYNASCAGCHTSGAAGAPKLGNKGDWAPRIKRGISDLLKVAISGKGAMPPKGTCMSCSDDELKAAIEFMTK